MTSPTTLPQDETRSELRRGILWAFPQLGLLAFALVTMPRAEDPVELHSVRQGETGPPTDSQVDDVSTDPAPPSDATPSSNAGGVLPATDIGALIRRLPFEQRGSEAGYSDLLSLLRGKPGPAVSVINLWASYCEPCKREFPAFRQLQQTWSNEVRFVSVQLGKDHPGELLSALPTPTVDLYDIGAGAGTIREKLAALGLAEKNAPIPITMVLDCRHKLRWLRTGEITKDMSVLGNFIDALREELRTNYCAPPSPTVVSSEPGEAMANAGPRCGNDRCDAGETYDNCCQDCPCPGTQRCTPRPNGSDVCLLPSDDLVK